MTTVRRFSLGRRRGSRFVVLLVCVFGVLVDPVAARAPAMFDASAKAVQSAVRGNQIVVDPAPPLPPAPTLPGCPATGRAAVADKRAQRFWLCEDGTSITPELRMTTASARYGLPPVGVYRVFAKDRLAFGAHGEHLHRFVAFYTTPRGNRIAFHQFVNQDAATVGDLDQRGQSAGCFRVLPGDSVMVWDFLGIGDPVVVLTN